MASFPPKKVNNSDPGTADLVGGDDWDKLADYFNTVDVTGPAKINTKTQLRSGKLEIRNPADTFSYILKGSAITTADKDLTLPNITANDEVVTKDATQTLTAKTFNNINNTFNFRDFTRIKLSGSTYYAIKQDGSILGTPSANPEDAFQSALDNGGLIIPENRTFTFSSGFAGLATSQTRWTVLCSRATAITLPSGFSGTFLTLTDQDHCAWNGGRISEASSVSRLWTGFKITSAASTGSTYNRITNVDMASAGVGIHLATTTSGSAFNNGNYFANIVISSPIIGVKFSRSDAGAGMTYNYFEDIQIQAATGVTTDGFKDVQERMPIFINCIYYDGDSGSNQMNIDSTCNGAFIIGGNFGSATGGTFTDSGSNTIMYTFGKPMYINSFMDLKEITAPGNPASGFLRVYADVADHKLKRKNSAGTVVDLEA